MAAQTPPSFDDLTQRYLAKHGKQQPATEGPATPALSGQVDVPQLGMGAKFADLTEEMGLGYEGALGALLARTAARPENLMDPSGTKKWSDPGKIMRSLGKNVPGVLKKGAPAAWNLGRGAAMGGMRGGLFRALMMIPHPVAKLGALGMVLAPMAANFLASRTSPDPVEQQARGIRDPDASLWGIPHGLGKTVTSGVMPGLQAGFAGRAMRQGARAVDVTRRGGKGVGMGVGQEVFEGLSGKPAGMSDEAAKAAETAPSGQARIHGGFTSPDRFVPPVGAGTANVPPSRFIPPGGKTPPDLTQTPPTKKIWRPGHEEHGTDVPSKLPGISDAEHARINPSTPSEAIGEWANLTPTSRTTMLRQSSKRPTRRFLPKQGGPETLVTKSAASAASDVSDVSRATPAAPGTPPNPRQQARQARTAKQKTAQVDAAKARVGPDYKPKPRKVTLEMADGKTKTLTVLGNKGRLAEFTPDFNELYKANKSIINKAVGAANKTGWDTLAKQLNYMSHNDYSPQDIAQQLSQLWKIEGGPSMAREILKLAPESWLTQKSKAAIRSALNQMRKDM